jgi:prepilin-type N-terminal cleavage/methylation domain-containing protein
MASLRRQDGFTLIELLVSMVVFGILVSIAFPLLGSAIRHEAEVQERSALQNELRWSVERLAREVRQAYPGDTDAKFALPLDADELTFYSPDTSQPFRLRRISYRLSGGRLERAETVSTDNDGAPWTFPAPGPWTPVLDSITNSAVFTYEDDSGAATTDPLQVRTVGLQLVLATTTAPARPVTFRTTVEVRTQ